ncbi:Appr-1-p processing protein [Streptomyces sp. CC53]|uniref:macro domain-containing protein n=1 Tax=unclassified Streptomyces TaxID=2593676 RepID=UPI0008DD1203|nr:MULTISPECIES: macro domain-containing protein [unclassified Streptomyces]OII63682.1 Appr-1-p processing protein [Streptomyces sp. CC53]
MTGIAYVQGDATAPVGGGARIVAHVCNDVGGWGRGFVLAVSRRWDGPEAEFRRWYRERDRNDFGLGALQPVRAEPDLWVANMVGRHGLRVGGRGTPVRYEAVNAALGALGDRAVGLGASMHMPRIGCGLAGGTWARVEPLVRERLSSRGIPVTVYDLPD